MAFIDSAINNPKLSLVSEPWNQDDLSMKNRASVKVYTDDANCGFTVFLNHPSEVGKKVQAFGKEMLLSSLPVQARMDAPRFIMVMNSIRRLIRDKEYKGRTYAVLGNFYGANGDIVKTDPNKKGPEIVSYVTTGRDADGCIIIGVKEAKHPERDARPGALFKFGSGMWFNVSDNANDSKLSAAEDSKENAEAMVELWQRMVILTLKDNWEKGEETRKERQLKRAQMRQNNGGQQQQSAPKPATAEPLPGGWD